MSCKRQNPCTHAQGLHPETGVQGIYLYAYSIASFKASVNDILIREED